MAAIVLLLGAEMQRRAAAAAQQRATGGVRVPAGLPRPGWMLLTGKELFYISADSKMMAERKWAAAFQNLMVLTPCEVGRPLAGAKRGARFGRPARFNKSTGKKWNRDTL